MPKTNFRIQYFFLSFLKINSFHYHSVLTLMLFASTVIKVQKISQKTVMYRTAWSLFSEKYLKGLFNQKIRTQFFFESY